MAAAAMRLRITTLKRVLVLLAASPVRGSCALAVMVGLVVVGRCKPLTLDGGSQSSRCDSLPAEDSLELRDSGPNPVGQDASGRYVPLSRRTYYYVSHPFAVNHGIGQARCFAEEGYADGAIIWSRG